MLAVPTPQKLYEIANLVPRMAVWKDGQDQWHIYGWTKRWPTKEIADATIEGLKFATAKRLMLED